MDDQRYHLRFINIAHFIDHYVLLVFPTVVIGLEFELKRSYAELIALSTACFVAFGLFSLPWGWLADHWSRRKIMAIFFFGCAISMVAAAAAPECFLACVRRLLLLGHLCRDLSSGRHSDAGDEGARPRPGLCDQRRVGKFRCRLRAGHHGCIDGDGRLALGFPHSRGGLRRCRYRLSLFHERRDS